MNLKASVALVAGLALLGCSFGCASQPKDNVENKDGTPNYAYLDDATLESFDADLRALANAVRRAETAAEQSLRIKLGESTRRYQAALISALNDNSSTPRRRIAGVLLGFTGDSTVVGPLLAKVLQDEPESIRLNAALGLATLGDKLRDYSKHAELMRGLAKVMDDRDSSPAMRRAAVMAYACAYDSALNDGIQPLRDRFLSDHDLGVQIEAVNGLGRVADPVAAADLTKIGLTHPSVDIRIAAAIALGRVPDSSIVVPALVNAAADESSAVRREAVNSLAAHAGSNPEVVYDAIQLALGDFSDLVRESAALALARVKDARAVEPLLQATGDRVAVVRRAAAIALGDLITRERAKDAFPLVDLIEDENPDVQRAAASTLVRVTAKDFGADMPSWRQYFYTAWPELDPKNAYVGKPRPRITSNLQGSGSRPSYTQPTTQPRTTPRTTPSRPSSTTPRTNTPRTTPRTR
ncbi:MAG: HEAT repeat domain-containing protein [Planctomycetes bacterium]|nr:HEAT repeat domain-containing protein [Planctomycetota bacterium]